MSREALNANQKSVFRQPMSVEDQVGGLLRGEVTKVRIDPLYTATSTNGYVTIWSTAPGALDNEQIGIFPSSIKALAAFLATLYRAQHPESVVMQSPEKAEEFVKELSELPAEGEKAPEPAPEAGAAPRKAIRKGGDKTEADLSS